MLREGENEHLRPMTPNGEGASSSEGQGLTDRENLKKPKGRMPSCFSSVYACSVSFLEPLLLLQKFFVASGYHVHDLRISLCFQILEQPQPLRE